LRESQAISASLEVDASIIDKLSQQIGSGEDNFYAKKSSPAQEKIIADKTQIAQEKIINKQGGSKANQVATIVARPLPEIPEELRQEAFVSKAIARFYIADDGEVRVELIQPCNNPRLNQLLLKSLRKWKFSPAHKMGIATASVQDVQINFKVE